MKNLLLILSLSWSSLAFAGKCDLKTEVQHPTAPMRSMFVGEENEGHYYPPTKGVSKFTYFYSDEERAPYHVTFYKGRLLGADCKAYQAPAQKVDYVMDSAGNFFLFYNKVRKEIRHSSFFAGGPVAGAGEMRLDENSQLFEINADSGHYIPKRHFFENVLQELSDDGVQIQKLRVEFPEESSDLQH